MLLEVSDLYHTYHIFISISKDIGKSSLTMRLNCESSTIALRTAFLQYSYPSQAKGLIDWMILGSPNLQAHAAKYAENGTVIAFKENTLAGAFNSKRSAQEPNQAFYLCGPSLR